jgi:taurine dioxygenase
MTANALEAIDVIPSGKALGAEVQGLDLAQEMTPEMIAQLKAIWAEHMVLLLRSQMLEKQRMVDLAEAIGGLMVPGSTGFYLQDGFKPGSARVSEVRGITLISNLDKDGNPQKFTAGSGSSELAWHTDNSYMETPPMGSMLNAVRVPVDGGGDTSFCNQVMAYDTLAEDLKRAIEGKHIRHDRSRNTSGKVRVTFEKPKTREEVPGPIHPMVRIHPTTGKRALYLGRRWDFPSSYVVELSDAESESLLDRVWAHATQERFIWTQADWQVGDLIMWDNQAVMHRRTVVDPTQARLMHRTLVQGEPFISAWDEASAAE